MVIYKPGSTNLKADALSRHSQPPLQLNAVSYCSPTWLAEVAAGYTSDPVSRALVQELSVDPESHPPYSLINGVLRIRDRIWVGNNKPLQLRICFALHASAMGGHLGFPVIYARAKKLFAWHGMKSDIKQFVASCTVCLQAKPDRAKYPGLLSLLPVPAESWQVISMDFIEGFLVQAMPTVFWWSSTGLANSPILFLCCIHLPLPKWHIYSSITFTAFMACQHILYQSEIGSSPAYFGRSCSVWRRHNSV